MKFVIALIVICLGLLGCDDAGSSSVFHDGGGSASITGDMGFSAAITGRTNYSGDGGWDSRFLDIRMTSTTASCVDLVNGYPDGGSVDAVGGSWLRVLAWDPSGLSVNKAYDSATADDLAINFADGGGLDESAPFFYVIRSDLADGGGMEASWYSTSGTLQLSTFNSTAAAASFDLTLSLLDGGSSSHLSGTFSGDCVL